MVDMIELDVGEIALVDTTANIVAVINLLQKLEIRDSNDNVQVVLNWGETYTLGYNRGIFKLRNTGEYHGRVYVIRQFIL